ncbi:probable ATP-dependent RNA helicase DDX59, partial [Diadema antillarum]|uniref:probable ATP-dependent RNA helicase DDX59 n=1 Tax=Diadema antillarum TaxID=105358 RepID=UPI003A896916
MDFIPRAVANRRTTNRPITPSSKKVVSAQGLKLNVDSVHQCLPTREAHSGPISKQQQNDCGGLLSLHGKSQPKSRNAGSQPCGHPAFRSKQFEMESNNVGRTNEMKRACDPQASQTVQIQDGNSCSLDNPVGAVVTADQQSKAADAYSTQSSMCAMRNITPCESVQDTQVNINKDCRSGGTGLAELQTRSFQQFQQLQNQILTHISKSEKKERENYQILNDQSGQGSSRDGISEDVHHASGSSTTKADSKHARTGSDDSSLIDRGDVKMEDKQSETCYLDEELADDRPPVISFSKLQRWPEMEEPVCIVCGRYGEYICDQTEADVCSLECKARNLTRMGLQSTPNIQAAELEPAEDDSNTSQSEETTSRQPTDNLQGLYIYSEHSSISSLSHEQVQDIRNEAGTHKFLFYLHIIVQIFVEGVDVARPIMEFYQLSLPEKLQANLKLSGYLTPTPIQMQAIPVALSHRDVMVCAQTSSGKTASFLVSSVMTIYNEVLFATSQELQWPHVLILTPTRELAMQIEEQAKQLMKGLANMKTALLVGGLSLPPQLHRLRQGVQFIVGTPGRILEIMKQEALSLDNIKLVVIDEVDTMLQLGFQQQVYDIMMHLPDEHQTFLTSATIPIAIEKMALSLLNNPVFISVGTPSTPCTSVKQIILWVEEPSKKKKLFAVLQDPKHFSPPLIIFVDSKMGADLLAQAVEKSCGLTVASIHGDKPQRERMEVLQHFKDKAYQVLVSTGVIGRGIDLPGVQMVINFDMPASVEDYIHQVSITLYEDT